MKALDANVTTQIDAQHRKARLLFEIALTGLTLRYTANISSIAFPYGGTVYTAKAVMFGGSSQSLEGQICRISLKFDNVAKDMATYAHLYDFEGRYLTIKRVFLDANNNAPATSTEFVEVFHGKMEQPVSIDQQWLSITATEGVPLNKKVLDDIYGKECRHTFGGAQCNKDGLANLASLTASGTANSGSTTTLVDNIASFTKGDDYWNYGKILITKGGTTYKRKVKSFVSNVITFDLALPVAVDGSTTYVVHKGCSKTWDACQAKSNFGPSGDNQLNYGGCIHIGIWRED